MVWENDTNTNVKSTLGVKPMDNMTIDVDRMDSRALHWVPIPMPTHAHGFWVGIGCC